MNLNTELTLWGSLYWTYNKLQDWKKRYSEKTQETIEYFDSILEFIYEKIMSQLHIE